ncbi:DUF4253 domain-containing protein [Streptomyces sp. NPDC052415]|uniref:DUF4253 domain-containing protein n=1 Tax=Streptomyces sp. NPDC052415 TaxID=3365690 RepID=UPI0037D31580
MIRFLREVVADLGFDAPVLERTVSPGDVDLYGFRCPDAVRRDALWQRLRERHRESGLWPFLTHGSPTDWEWEGQRPATSRPAVSGVLAEIVASQAKTVAAYTEGVTPCGHEEAEVVRHVESTMGALAPCARGEPISRRFAHESEWICLIEADQPSMLTQLLHAPFTPNWASDGQVPLLGYGEHQAVLREWEIRYGAAPYYLGSSGALVLEVERPPSDPAEIARVAVEQYAYCLDLEQVIGGPTTVAERQVPCPHWFFWWD